MVTHKSGLKATVTTGHKNRLESVSAKIEKKHLDKGSEPNGSSRKYAKNLGQKNDDAGHAIAKRLGGSGGVKEKNIFPQNLRINRGAFRSFEDEP